MLLNSLIVRVHTILVVSLIANLLDEGSDMDRPERPYATKRSAPPKQQESPGKLGKPHVSLKILGEYLGLSPATISLVINNAPGAKSISPPTRLRVLAAAKKFDYRPSFFARALQGQRTFSVGVLLPQLNDDYSGSIMEGVEEVLVEEGYFYLTASHHRKPDLIDEYSNLLMDRAVEGFILIDTPTTRHDPWSVPVVAVAGHRQVPNVTNLTLDQRFAAELGLRHLYELGHRKIAIMRGAACSSDSDDRWNSFRDVAIELGIPIDPQLTLTIPLDMSSPELGYPAACQLLTRKKPFTAIIAFNDLAAIGAMCAIREHGFRIPEDISVLGFDDIKSAAYQYPSLTTIRQPLHHIGRTAALTLLRRITHQDVPDEPLIPILPELVVRQSTGVARSEDEIRPSSQKIRLY
jgi:DNA-binding LacI/PurR family transcriptional regulator